MLHNQLSQNSSSDSAATTTFSIFCGQPSIKQGYIDHLTQQGLYHDSNAMLTLILDIPLGIALKRMEEVGTGTQQVVTVTWSTCAEYWEDLWDLRPHILLVGDGLIFDVAQALRGAEQGLRYRRTLDHPLRLQPSERRILRLIAQGLSNREITVRLGTSLQTIKNSLTIIYQKLHVANRSQAILYYWGIWHIIENN